VGLLLNNYDDITWFHPWVLVGLAMEDILLVVGCTLIDLSFYDLFFFNDFFAITIFAFVLFIDDLTLAIAVIARSL
jgi:hypothetical protein